MSRFGQIARDVSDRSAKLLVGSPQHDQPDSIEALCIRRYRVMPTAPISTTHAECWRRRCEERAVEGKLGKTRCSPTQSAQASGGRRISEEGDTHEVSFPVSGQETVSLTLCS